MTNLHHHPHDETLMSFAAGALNGAFALVVSCHLQFCQSCRREVRQMEEVGGLLLETILPTADDAGFLERAMKRFSREVAPHIDASRPLRPLDPGDDVLMPGPLARTTGLRRDTIPWSPVHDGRRLSAVARLPGAAAQLVSLDPNSIVPAERSGGQLILVLWGDYDFNGKRYARGDLHDLGGSCAASFVAGPTEGVTFLSALSPVSQIDLVRTAH